MSGIPGSKFTIRRAVPGDYDALGRMTVTVYERLPDMPGPDEQPEYYAMLADVASRAAVPGIEILVAAGPDNIILGGVTFVGDMAGYNAGGSAHRCRECAGIRLLAVAPAQQRHGIGKALTLACIRRARELGRAGVVLHTTKSMMAAWQMYTGMGFNRAPELDFSQGRLPVYGFRLDLAGPEK